MSRLENLIDETTTKELTPGKYSRWLIDTDACGPSSPH
jgi:hypothetical protein